MSNIFVYARYFASPCDIARPKEQFVGPAASGELDAFIRGKTDSHVSKVANFLNPMVSVDYAFALE